MLGKGEGDDVDEQTWLNTTDLNEMLCFLRDSGWADRKLKLFGAACCRRIWRHFSTADNREVVELLERVADDPACTAEFTDACSRAAAYRESEEGRRTEIGCSAAYAAASIAESYPGEHPAWVATNTADCCRTTLHWVAYEKAVAAGAADKVARAAGEAAQDAEEAVQAALLRDIFGSLPFRPLPPLPPSARTWNDGLIPKLAASIYEQPKLPEGTLDSVRLGVLADALEEAGVTDQEVLGHLRRSGAVHVRGCFALDHILGKE